jgi:uncharacterized DUF497 family protein
MYQWKVGNQEHVAKHSVTQEEAEYVIDHARPPFPREIGDQERLVWGQTQAGRYLQVIFIYLEDDEVDYESMTLAERLRFTDGEEVMMVIHARDLTRDQKSQYRNLKGRQ